jgi:DNA-binding FadR family transcriptional regulator
MTEPSAVARTLAEHQAIYDAIVTRDIEMARSWR